MSEILQGHSLEVLRSRPDKSSQICVTSPPYFHLRSYGIPPSLYGGDAACSHEWVRSKATLLRDNRNNHTGAQPIGTAKGTIHIKKTAAVTVKVCSKCGAWEGYLGLEPTVDMFVDHLAEIFREVHRVLADDGTLFVNLGDSYGNGKNGTTNKSLLMVPERFAIRMCKEGWILRNKIVWAKQAYNALDNKVDGKALPSSADDRLQPAYEVIYFFTKQPSYKARIKNAGLPYTAQAIERIERAVRLMEKTGAVSTAASKEAGEKACETACETGSEGLRHRSYVKFMGNKDRVKNLKRNLPDVWRVNVYSYRGAHFATYSPWIPLLPILMFTDEGDSVLDPFAGSGTTAKVAQALKREYVAIEIGLKNVELIKKRVGFDNETVWITDLVKNNFPDTYAKLYPESVAQLGLEL